VVAQQPAGGYPPVTGGSYLPPPTGSTYATPKTTPTGGGGAAPTVRPYGDWTPTAPPPGYMPTQPGAVRPAGGSYLPPPAGAAAQPVSYPPPGGTPTNRPRPGVAGGDPIKPTGGFDIPPPSMDFPGSGAAAKPAPAAPAKPTLPPPSVSVEGADNKFPPAPPLTTPPAPGFVPVPPPGVTPPPAGVTPPPAGIVPPPVAPPAPPAGGSPKPFPVPPAPDAGPLTPAAPPTAHQGVPTRVNQSVTVEAICPEAVVYGTEFRYELVVRNAGNVAVQNVRVEDEIPAGARYVGSDPPGELNGDRLVWAIGALDSQGEKRIAVRVRPTEEGELRSRATIGFAAVVDAKTRVTRPRVAIAATCQEVCKAGEDAVFQVKVTNSGTGPAQNMVLRAEMTDGLYFSQGSKLETKLANLPAGETKTLTLPLSAVKAGLHSCQFTVTAEGSADATGRASVNVVEPLLQISQTGPSKCLVRAEPTYEITLSNPGTAATDAVTLHAVLPDGFDFVQASDAGAFTATNRAVSWKLPGLPAGGTKAVAVKLRASAAGDVVLRTVAVSGPEPTVAPAGAGPVKPAGRVLEAKAETAVKAEGVAAVRFDVKGLENPVEVGKDAVYEIRITNQGTGVCSNVQVMAAMAENTTFTGSNGPTTVKAQGQTLVFEPIGSLAVKGEVVYTVRVRGTTAGDHRFRVQLTCDQVRTPVVKEESTSFYKQ
jgi:uncharacterized repeat protein (TIGR01451 family)